MPLSISSRRHARGPLLLALFALAGLIIPGTVLAKKPAPPVNIQILNVSDWHANLDPASSSGGAWNISARWKADRAAHNGPTLTLTAGDDFGAAPPLSGFFDEVPSIQAQRLMGIQVNTFGNHNFDRGISHLQSMIDLAAAPSTGTSGAHPGQPFTYVATNLANLGANLTGVERIKYFTLGGAKVAVIGIVNEEAPTLVSVGNFGTIQVTDGVKATKSAAKEARKAGAKAVIVITHKGVTDATAGTGPLTDFVNALPGGMVDLVIGDHTNIQLLRHRGAQRHPVPRERQLRQLVREDVPVGHARQGPGRRLQVRRVRRPDGRHRSTASVTGGVVDTCPATGFCDQDIVNMLVPFRVQLAAALDGRIGTTAKPFDRGSNIERRQEVPLGDLLADSLTANYGVQIGLYTGGSIRSQFPACGYRPVNTGLNRGNYADDPKAPPTHVNVVTCTGYASGTPYDLVIGDVYTVLPFGNNIVTRTVTGEQLWRLLENSVSHCPVNYDPNNDGQTCDGRFPQISGIKFTFDKSRATGCTGAEVKGSWICAASGGRVTAVSLSNGTAIPADATTYTFATTDFTNNGGDSYFMLADGQGVSRDRDANSFLDYLQDIGGALDPPTIRLTASRSAPAPRQPRVLRRRGRAARPGLSLSDRATPVSSRDARRSPAGRPSTARHHHLPRAGRRRGRARVRRGRQSRRRAAHRAGRPPPAGRDVQHHRLRPGPRARGGVPARQRRDIGRAGHGHGRARRDDRDDRRRPDDVSDRVRGGGRTRIRCRRVDDGGPHRRAGGGARCAAAGGCGNGRRPAADGRAPGWSSSSSRGRGTSADARARGRRRGPDRPLQAARVVGRHGMPTIHAA